MKISDPVYGVMEVTDSAVKEIIGSPHFQRLKRIGSGGLLGELKEKGRYARQEHSIGTMMLLQRLGAGREEQIAGLLHDVSHTAFSHTVDYVLGDPLKSDFQDANHERYLATTNIPAILKKQGLPESCAQHPDAKHFPLLEQDAPRLCGDRVDYTLRNGLYHNFRGPVSMLLRSLAVYDNRIVLSSLKAAKAFWQLYDHLEETVWAGPSEIARMQLLGQAMKLVYDDGQLAADDFYTDDAKLESVLRKSKNPKVRECLALLDNGFRVVRDDKHPDYGLRQKFRHVDPEFLEGEKLLKLSHVLPAYKKWYERVSAQEKYTPQGIPVRIVPA